jgi:hypothetical protein
LEFDENGESPIGSCIMSFKIDYITCMPESIEDQEQANVTPLEKISAVDESGTGGAANGWDLFREDIDGLDGAIDAEDIIDLPQ